MKGAEDGVPVAEAEVTLVDESTGTTKTTTTNSDGVFAFTNLQVGGPYHVTATVMGFKPAEEKDIFLSANRTRDVALGLRLQEEVIEVAGTAVARNTSNRTVITAAEIESLPSVGRDPRDVMRRNPEVSVEGAGRTLTIGGANNRYNSMTVDGIRQDDDFGLNTTNGYPTRRSPISLSAIQELTVDSSPFDVRYGKFLGGNVNIVTKSGTNEFKGSLITSYTSDAMQGNRFGNTRVSVDYSEFRYGATVGGPIIKDKLFFLASIEGLRSTRPIDNGAADSTAANKTNNITNDDVIRAQQIARDVYDFDAGVPSQSGNENDLKLLGKLDWTISQQHRASASYQRTGSNAIQVGTGATATRLPLSSNWYDGRDTLNTFSGRLFSDWSDQLSTEVEANAKIVESRVPPLNGNDFMSAVINFNLPGQQQSQLTLGPDQFRHANLLDNDVFHTKAEANYLLGAHLFTGGIEYELTRIRNLFVAGSHGVATYASLDAFERMQPTSIFYNNSVTLNPLDAAANWNSGMWTAYAQDQLKLTSELTLQGGVRFEVYQTGSKVTRNQNFVDRNGFGNDATLNGRTSVLPRLGISWLPMNNLNVRAGVGMYSGGTPSVWVSNNYTNDGVRTFSFTCRNVADPVNCPDPTVMNGFNGRDIPQALKDRVVAGAGNGNVDALDPDFKIPSVWKIGTGADYSLDIPGIGDSGKNIELKANYTFTKVSNGVTWEDLRRDSDAFMNNKPIGNTIDGRPFYPSNFPVNRGTDMLLTNDDRGYSHVASLVVQKGFPFGLFVSGAYAYTYNQEVSPATASVSTSNYSQVAVVDPDHPALAPSNNERRHRFTGAIEYSHSIVGELTDATPWKDMKTSFGMFVESRSGQPFSWTFSGAGANSGNTLAAIFGEDSTNAGRSRELFFVPTDARTCETPGPDCDVLLRGMTKEQFNIFLDRTGLSHYRGKIAPRNAFNSPWFTRLDVRLAQDLPNPLSGQRARFVLDIENVGNLLNHDWGRSRSVGFPYTAPAVAVDINRDNGTYIYSGLASPNPNRIDILQSVWRVSLGLMYDF